MRGVGGWGVHLVEVRAQRLWDHSTFFRLPPCSDDHEGVRLTVRVGGGESVSFLQKHEQRAPAREARCLLGTLLLCSFLRSLESRRCECVWV